MAATTTKHSLLAGVDIGGTKIHTLIVDDQYRILASARKKTKSEGGFRAVMERVVETIDEAAKIAGIPLTALAAIGVGAPSPIREDGVAVHAPNMGWKEVPLVKTLEHLLRVPVVAENDCNVGTLGEFHLGAGKGARSLIGLFVGTGLGGGIVWNGEMIRGENRMAAEVGHMIVQVGGRRCGCGHQGCLEAYVSKTGMGRKFAYEIIHQGRSSILTKLTPNDYSNIKSSILLEAYQKKDPLVVETLHEAMTYLGIGIANLITLLGPERIVLGGGVLEAFGKTFLPLIRKAAEEATHPPASFSDTKILLASLGDDAVALGAAVYARESLAQKK